MKVLAFVLAVYVAVSCNQASAFSLTEEEKAKLKEYKDACVAESGVDVAVVDAVIKGEEVTRDAKLDCYGSCILKKLNMQKEDGTLNQDMMILRALLRAKKIIDKCTSEVGKDSCETAGNALACFLKEKKSSPFFE